ncbi:ABC transporter substrate-binding protein [Pseudonocardia sp. ICBG601]|uniref:ABC transporter substrate-binding protein n=1 Tax=Pseudonocardia sp. ICBG601 TaxID=2846759 RepID=UPI001CF65BAE|nr:ABC transporter substrate-binding protein [Pseudonocardia sp. ICBG601]
MRHNGIRLLTGVLAACAMLLAGCGSGGGEAQNGSGETRVVTDDFGTQVAVPVRPERVVATFFSPMMGLLDLGVTPVGAAAWQPPLVTSAYADRLAGVPVVTSREGEPELEQIAAQSPDLIVATSYTNEQVIGRLRTIAPTYVVRLSAGGANATSWQDRSKQLGDVLGRSAENDRLAADFAARVQQIKQTYAPRIAGRTVAIVAGFQENNAAVFSAASGSGRILTDLGFRYSAQADAVAARETNGLAQVSFERIGSVAGDADTLFLGSDLQGRVSPFVTSLQQTQLYKDLPSVKANRVGAFKPQVTGYTDATFLLDQVEKALKGMQG